LVLFLIPLQFVYLFCNLSECILLFFSCISFLLLFNEYVYYNYMYNFTYVAVYTSRSIQNTQNMQCITQ
jgi:hypothetical protein